jgi:type VI secretion system ImpB/VipA family protein
MTYDVEIGDAIENKELPFVLGVVGDFGGNSVQEARRLKDRQVRQHRQRQLRRSAGRDRTGRGIRGAESAGG